MTDERGQAYTLEGVTVGTLLLLVLFLSMQSIVITPTTEGSVDRTITSQLSTEANDVLVAAHEHEELAEAALFWDHEEENWTEEWILGDCPQDHDGAELGLCTKLEETFTDRYYRYNVYVDYRNADRPHETETVALFEQGSPGDTAAVATHSVAIYENMSVAGEEDRTVASIEEEFYADNLDDDNLYTIVEIRVIVW